MDNKIHFFPFLLDGCQGTSLPEIERKFQHVKKENIKQESYQIRDKSFDQMSYNSMTYYIFAFVLLLLFICLLMGRLGSQRIQDRLLIWFTLPKLESLLK